MIIGVPAHWWIKQALCPSTGIGRAQLCAPTQHTACSMTTTLTPYQIWTRGIVRRTYLIVLMIIPIRTPFTHLPRHPSYPTLTHICWILLCWSWSFDLGNMLCSPGGKGILSIGAVPSAGQPRPMGGLCRKGAACNVISTAAPPWLPGISPGEDISLRPTSCIHPLRFCWEPHLCPRTVSTGILPGNRTHRQLQGSWTRTAIEPGAVLFPMTVRVNGLWIVRRLHKAKILLDGNRIEIHPNSASSTSWGYNSPVSSTCFHQ